MKTLKMISPTATVRICIAVLAFTSSAGAFANVKPSQLCSDHAVLQSGMQVPVWSTADPGEKVSVTLQNQKQSAIAGADGRWMLKLGKLKPGGPFVMSIAGKKIVAINDVLVGEDWIGSGQSDMAFTVSAKVASYAGMLDEDKEIAAANYPQLPIFVTKTKKSYEPETEIKGEWKLAIRENVPAFSAVAYLFGRDLNQALKQPVGVVVVASGASTAESWISRPVVDADPQLTPMLTHFDDLYHFYKAHPDATSDQAPVAPQTINSRPGKPGPLRDPVQDQHQPTVLYNGMVHPILPFAMRGVIWYQGESIVGGKAGIGLYPRVMEALVKEWRAEWGDGNFSFYCVQLPPLKTEGAVLFKAIGRYYLGAADDYEGRYSTCLAMADTIYGPYRMRHEAAPCAGGTGFFQDHKGGWWTSFFGNDTQTPFREKPAIVKIDAKGKVIVAAKQPLVPDWRPQNKGSDG